MALAAASFPSEPSTPCIPCQQKRAQARLAKHYEDIEKHRAKYDAIAKSKNLTAKQRRAYRNFVIEAAGEVFATEYMQDNHPGYEMASGFAPGTGMDQVWVKRAKDGTITDVIVVEAKGGSEKLKKTNKGKALQKKWVNAKVKEWENWLKNQPPGPEANDAKEVIAAMKQGMAPRGSGKPVVMGQGIGVQTNGVFLQRKLSP